MLIDVDDPELNVVLNLCFAGIALITVLSVVPWGLLGARTVARLAIWLPIPALLVGFIYESTMPVRYNIRVDLLLLVPAYGLILLASLIRLFSRWQARRLVEQRSER